MGVCCLPRATAHSRQATQALPRNGLLHSHPVTSGVTPKNTLIGILFDVRFRMTLQTGALYETGKY